MRFKNTRSYKAISFLATNREQVVAIVAIPVHIRVTTVHVPVPRIVAIVGATTPQVTVVAVIVRGAIVGVARKQHYIVITELVPDTGS